jgi:fumarate reductase subunit D
MPRRPVEPWLWLLFSAGGVAAALLVPVFLLLFGLAFPLGWVAAPDHSHLLVVLQNPLVRLVLLAVVVLLLFHWAHRFRYTLYDGLQLQRLGGLITALCYGGAVLGAAITAVVLWNVT